MDISNLSFKYGWRKPIKFKLNGQDFVIDCVFSAFQGEQVTNKQERSYKLFDNNHSDFELKVLELLNDYTKTNNISNSVVQPTALQFNRDGEFALLCNCSWDEEHGIAVILHPQQKVTMQDDFL